MKSTFNKYPATVLDGTLLEGWEQIISQIKNEADRVIAFDCYPGVCHNEIKEALAQTGIRLIDTASLMKTIEEIESLTARFMTDDILFGYITNLYINDYFDQEKIITIRQEIKASSDKIILYGHGAHYVYPDADILIFADMARWEIIQRFRRGEINGIGVSNCKDPVSVQYKRGYFNDWRIYDRYKRQLMDKVDFWVDTHIKNQPKMIDKKTFLEGLSKTIKQPFRVVPFFDPAPWGGQWMKKVCGLNPEKENYGWCFDCVPEENSLLLKVNNVIFEMPSVNLVLCHSQTLLGEPVEARFGIEFPIRFDFLDTFDGGNLSLQVHPTTQYIREQFGMQYTQDESYYILDAEDDATVYLGLKKGIGKQQMIDDLRKAQNENTTFDAEKYVNKIPAKKHDHFLIPGGTIHCSGRNALVLEISSTPNLFTFKLWDWARLGLDGKPRPINIEHGKEVIAWERDTDYTEKHLVNHIEPKGEGDGWWEEKTGLHQNEFIEVRRHWFTKKVLHNTNNSVNVINLAQGSSAVVESPTMAFEPFVVHYAETFIIPASIGEYSIAPYETSPGEECVTLKAYVRI